MGRLEYKPWVNTWTKAQLGESVNIPTTIQFKLSSECEPLNARVGGKPALFITLNASFPPLKHDVGRIMMWDS